MRQITKKVIITIDGADHLIEKSDFSEGFAQFENICESELNDCDVIDYVMNS